MAFPGWLLNALLGFGSRALGSRGFGPDPYRWWQDYSQTGRDRAWQEAELMRQLGLSIFDPLREGLLGDTELAQHYNRVLFDQYLRDAVQGGILSPQAAADRLGQYLEYRPEGFREAVGALAGTGDRLAGPMDLAYQIMQTGGLGPYGQGLLDFAGREMAGQGAPVGALADIGLDVLGRRGQDRYTQAWQDIGTQAAQTGGMTPRLGQAAESALGLISSQGWGPRETGIYDLGQSLAAGRGMTPEVSQLFALGRGLAGSRGLSPEILTALADARAVTAAGGWSPEARALYNQARDILTRREGQVMSPEEAAQAARTAAHLEQARQLEGAMRRAQARGGGAVVSGLQGRGMAEFADQMARAADEAALRASLSQQGLAGELARAGLSGALTANEDATRRLLTALGLQPDILRTAVQREGLGYGAMGDALARAAQYTGLGLGAMADAGRLAGAREGLGYSALQGIENAATARMEPLLRLAQSGAQLELSRMALGGNLLDQFNRHRLDAARLGSGLYGAQTDAALRAGSLYGNLLQTGQSGYQTMADLALRGGAFGLGLGQAYNQAINQANPYQLAQQWGTGWLGQSQKGLLDLYGPMASGWANIYNTTARPSVPGGVTPRDPWWRAGLAGAVKPGG